MALTSREKREREQRKRMARGKRNLSQLVGTQAQGQRTPMNRGSGYVNTVQAPKFPQSNVGDDITQAGLAYKGAKGIKDFATGTEGGYNKATGVWEAGKEPYAMPDIGGRLGQLNTDLGNFGKNVMNMEPGISAGPNVQSSWFGEPSKTLSMGGSGSGLLGNAATSRYGVLPPVPPGSTEYFKALQSPAGGAAQFSNASPEAVTGLTTAKEAGAGSDLMGGAGAALGAGLNIYDMTQQGVTAGNALGLGGSALLGISNAWNPLGLAMLGTSAAGSLFDWW